MNKLKKNQKRGHLWQISNTRKKRNQKLSEHGVEVAIGGGEERRASPAPSKSRRLRKRWSPGGANGESSWVQLLSQIRIHYILVRFGWNWVGFESSTKNILALFIYVFLFRIFLDKINYKNLKSSIIYQIVFLQTKLLYHYIKLSSQYDYIYFFIFI